MLAPTMTRQPHRPLATAGRHALLVDDEDLRELFGHGLIRSGVTVSTAADSTMAEALLCVERYDAAVLDWWLPGTSGFELCRLIRSMPAMAHIPIVIVTANTMLDPAMTMCAGATLVLHKPVSPTTLAATIDRLLAGR